MGTRKELEDRILHIIKYIDQDQMLQPLVWSIKLFQTEELLQLLNFLETWNYKAIYILLDNKIKEFLEIIEGIKQINIWKKMKNIKKIEKEERKNENLILENMLAF